MQKARQSVGAEREFSAEISALRTTWSDAVEVGAVLRLEPVVSAIGTTPHRQRTVEVGDLFVTL